MDDAEIPFLTGLLQIKSHSRISIKKSTNQKHCLLFKASRHGIERLEICDSENDKNPRIVTLENCVKITQEPAPANLINIITKTGQIILGVQSDEDLKKWVIALQTVAFKDKNSTLNRNSVIETDNDLYCSSYNEGIFTVTLIATDTSIRNKIEASVYNLTLTTTEIQLKSEDEQTLISKWPYRFIRKYGYRDGKFTFEAGRKCDTGEGIFRLEHPNPQEVFRCMAAKMKSMKKLITGESFTLPAALDCGENQLNAALSMEAGSRSPLPPSPNHPSSPDVDTSNSNTMSHASMRGFNSMESSLTIPSGSLVKSTPQKPPRINFGMNMEKTMCKIDENQAFLQPKPPAPPPQRSKPPMQNYESILDDKEKAKSIPSLKINNHNNNNVKSPELPARNVQLINKSNRDRDYECIENITDAWKTMGIDNIKHTENCTTPEEELVDFIFNQTTNKKRDNNINKDSLQGNYVATTKMLMSVIEIDSAGNYDRLEFFGPHNKKKSTPSSSAGYKTIVPINNLPTKSVTITDDYEFIGDPDENLVRPNQQSAATAVAASSTKSTGLETCRLADDSYLGYGVLRKTQHTPMITAEDDEQLLHHQQHNGLNYAIVSKPKRV